jgi:CRP-like cAMP-binding protein
MSDDAAPAGPERSRIFDGLSRNERLAWLDAAVCRDLGRGEVLARQGEPAGTFFLVESGLLKLVQSTADGHEVIVRFVGPAEPFGGVVALDRAAYPVSAIAVGPTRMRAWSSTGLGRLLSAHPQVRTNIMRELADHMTEAMTRVRELATERVEQRVARALVRLVRQCGQPTTEGVLIPYAITRQELAEISGTTIYTASRTLAAWQAEALVGTAGRRILVRDGTRLERIARGRLV